MGAPQGPPTSPNAIDLTDIDTVKQWLKSNKMPAGDADDYSIQMCITACSQWWLDQTGLGNQTGNDTQSPLNSVCTFNEAYDGNGSNTLYLYNRPIQSITSLVVGPVTIPQSTAWGINGWVIDQEKKSIRLRGGGGGTGTFTTVGFYGYGYGYDFCEGTQNVFVTYTAGFSSVPMRIQLAATQQVGQNIKRKEWIDIASRAMAEGAGTISFRSWKLEPWVQQVITDYTRTAM